MKTWRLVIVLTACMSYFQMTCAVCQLKWHRSAKKKVKNAIKSMHGEVVKDAAICRGRCLSKVDCVMYDIARYHDKKLHCLLYRYYAVLQNDKHSNHFEYLAKCRKKRGAPEVQFSYAGRYRVYTEPGGSIKKPLKKHLDCLQACFAVPKCHTNIFHPGACYLVTGKPIRQEYDHKYLTMTRGVPERRSLYARAYNTSVLNNTNGTLEPSYGNRLCPAFVATVLKPPTKECKYRYIGQYNITTSDQLTTVSATNIEACLEKCSQSESCHVASYHNGVCQLSTKERQSAVNRSMKNGSSLFVKQHCSVRPPPQSWMLFPVFQVLIFAISFQFLL